MDKENKEAANDKMPSYDTDAAELLDSLDDDEDEYMGYVPVGGLKSALTGMLASSANIESIATSSREEDTESADDEKPDDIKTQERSGDNPALGEKKLSLPTFAKPIKKAETSAIPSFMKGSLPKTGISMKLEIPEEKKSDFAEKTELAGGDNQDLAGQNEFEPRTEVNDAIEDEEDDEKTATYDRNEVMGEARTESEAEAQGESEAETGIDAENKEESEKDAEPKAESKSDVKPEPGKETEKTPEAAEDKKTEPDSEKKETAIPKIGVKPEGAATIKPFVPKEETKPAEKPVEKATEEPEESGHGLTQEIAQEATRTEIKEEMGPRPSMTGRRPPVPPPMPSISSVPRTRDEDLLTPEAVNDMLPGGKNDEARDLAAFKFNDNGWYTQIFNEDYLRTVSKNSRRQTQREARFIRERLGLQSKARVLDLCCGFGRHTVELARAGFDMVGLDLSMAMLKYALKNAQDNNLAIKFVHGDMRKLAFKSIFDAIYNVDTSFGYFDDQSNFKVLQGVFRALKPGGIFLVETANRDFFVDELPLRLWWKGIECMLLEEIDMDHLNGVLRVQRSFVFDGNTRAPWEQKIQIRLYSISEMRTLLKRAGFNVVELSGDYSLPGAHFGAASPKNIFIAEKPIK